MSIQEQIAKYNWYHVIEVEGQKTPGIEGFTATCKWATELLSKHSLSGKSVLDVGARDCYASLFAERMGAAQIDAIDNDVSKGAKEFLLPYLKSKINLQQCSLYDIGAVERYDAVLFFGVFYHLRYPFRALRTLVDALALGGEIFIEGGFLKQAELQAYELLYCPVESSPYDPSSCTFFNPLALDTTMRNMGCEKIDGMAWYGASDHVDRGFVAYRKARRQYFSYWEPGGEHSYHTRLAHNREDWQPTESKPDSNSRRS